MTDWGGKVAMFFGALATVSAALAALVWQVAKQPLSGLLLSLFVILAVLAGLSFLALLFAGLRALWLAWRQRRKPFQIADQNAYQIRNQYVGATASRIDYREAISSLLDWYLEVFVGREEELGQLASFAAGGEPGYRLVEAPPGYGKSALVAQLIRRRETGCWNGSVPDIIYYFIREDGRRHTPSAFCSAVNSQLLTLLGLSGGVPADLDSQQNQLLDLWARAVDAARDDRPLLLLVDGLDEMAPGQVRIADLLPSKLKPYVHVVVTSRPNPQPLEQVPLDHPFGKASVMRLDAFGLADIEDLLRLQGASAEIARKFAPRTLRVTKGEPLLARFISQDVAAGGEKILADLERDPPAGVKQYFRDQIKQLKARAQGEVSRQILGVLFVAHGPMVIDELAETLDLPLLDIDDALEPMRRFLLGEDRFEFMHMEFRSVVGELFTTAEKQADRRRIVSWCKGFADGGWPDNTPEYVLRNYAAHLGEVGENELLYRLIDRRWMDLKVARTHSHRDFANDVLLAINVAEAESPPNLVQEIRGSLIYATLNSLATNIPPELLGVLAQSGQIARAQGYATLIGDPYKRAEAFIAIAAALSGQNKTGEAKTAVEHALAAADTVTDTWGKFELTFDAAVNMTESGLASQAVAVAEQAMAMAMAMTVAEEEEEQMAAARVGLLSFLAWALAAAGQGSRAEAAAEEAITAAQAITGAEGKAYALAFAAQALAKVGNVERAVTVAKQASTAAGAATDTWGKAQALAAIANALALAGRTDQAIATAQAISEASYRAKALARVARTLAEGGRAEQAITAVHTIAGGSDRVKALADVAQALAKAGKAEQAAASAEQALTAAQASGTRGHTSNLSEPEASAGVAQALVGTSRALAEVGKTEQAAAVAEQAAAAAEQALTAAQAASDENKAGALAALGFAIATGIGQIEHGVTIVQAINDESDRTRALANMAQGLAQVGQADQAMTAARAIVGDWDKARALTAVAMALIQAGHAEQAVAAAQAITGDWLNARALADVAQALVQAGQVEQALAAARAVTADGYKAWALADVAQALARAGQVEQALAAARAVTADGPDGWKARVLAGVARALAQAGQVEQAVAAAEQAITADGDNARVLADVAQALALAGQVDQAMTAAQAITTDWYKAWVLADVAKVLAQAGRAEQAVTVARAITRESDKANTLAHVAKALGEAGQSEQADLATELAVTVAQAITSESDKANTLADMAKTLAEGGQAEQAIAVAQAITSDQRKTQALAGVAKTLAEVGQLERALTVAERILTAAKAINDYSDRAETLTALARVLAKLGHGDQALAMVKAIGDHESRTEELTAIAYDLAKTGRLQSAVAVIECALTAARINGRASFFRLLGELAGSLSIITPQNLYEIGQEVVSTEKLWRE